MILECGHCGAPLDVREGVSITKCKYCGKSNERQRMRTISAQTPRDFRPPQQWIPPTQFPAPSNLPLKYHGNRAPLVIALVTFAAIAGIGATMVGVGASVWSISRTSHGTSKPGILSSGATPAMLAALDLNQNPAGIAKTLSVRPSEIACTYRCPMRDSSTSRFPGMTNRRITRRAFTWQHEKARMRMPP